MNTCRLGYLVDKLDKTDDWQHKLSPGELQRVAFVRALLSQPKVILLDEATAALDEPTEALLYRALKRKTAAEHHHQHRPPQHAQRVSRFQS